MARKVIITCALTGAFHGKEANPNLPEQPSEIIASAYDAYNAGASVVHIHTRDKDGKSTCDANTFAEINSGIRAKCNLILQNSTAPATRIGAVADDGLGALTLSPDVRPEMCSLDCSLISTTWESRSWIYEWTRPWLIKTAGRMKELGIKPELEVFNPVSIEDVFNYLKPAGVIDDPVSLTFVMGMDKASQGAISFSNDNLNFMIKKLPPTGVSYTCMAIGHHQLPATIMCLLQGGNVRVGMEDNIFYSKGVLAKSNAQLVERIAKMIVELGMEVATPDEARQMLKIPPCK